ncbi:unnamed protein product [Adineta ricciae]|uniref:Uncharacterized protein n=1 Tax=Adineta ricciae TaxID=249248 RepID=A0A813S2Y6_ADIRI|nr:unnamed protein product [Adineta ricciae]
MHHQPTYESQLFGYRQCRDQNLLAFLRHLQCLPPMDKNGPMNGRCSRETEQMEQFLNQTFGFTNIPQHYIVPGVKSFSLQQYPHQMQSDAVIYFPHKCANSFAMTTQEIKNWQRSYRVYAAKNVNGMSKETLHKALQGKSEDGSDAFRMKFVVRISTCPILMEFDAKVIPRRLTDEWPNRIKLVSVTGIDFAGRKHDIGDIQYYLLNWQKLFHLDPRTGLPVVHNGRDFYPVSRGPSAILDEKRLRDSLTLMVRLRLRACDEEGVHIVVETGIGLGVFSGKQLGIDHKVRRLSARAAREVLEEDGPSYKSIRAVVFALPVFNQGRSHERVPDTYDDFVNEFRTSNYNGRIPVLVADQDMHRLTVAIARRGYTVSELNPADSHGVFGEYWQNRGPAVEEKLALTTVGLLVQHHLINAEVLNKDRYQVLDMSGTPGSEPYVKAIHGNRDDRNPHK